MNERLQSYLALDQVYKSRMSTHANATHYPEKHVQDLALPTPNESRNAAQQHGRRWYRLLKEEKMFAGDIVQVSGGM
jgi:hypothetical protein